MSGTEEAKPPTSKRTRVGTACHECRRKKVRCDGATPQCGNCRQKNIKCEFPDKFIRANASQDYVKFLETRLGILESSAQHSPLGAYTPEMCDIKPAKQQLTLDQVSEPGPGSSSVLSFMSLVEAAAGKPKIETSPKPHDHNPYSRKRAIHPQSHALPTREVGDELMETFLHYVYPLFPVVYRPTFMEDFETLWMGKSSDINYALINIVFAIGAILTDRKDDNIFFSRARVYLDSSIMRWTFSGTEGVPLESLQAILLTSYYLLLTQQVGPCRNLLALLTRTASESRKHFEVDNIKKEIFSRLWYSCISIDRLVSIIFGKPIIVVSDMVVDKPIAADDEYLATFAGERGAIPSPQALSVVSFFVQSIGVTDITTDILRLLYNNEGTGTTTLGMSRKNTLRAILEIESRLISYENQMPEHLQLKMFNQNFRPGDLSEQSFVMHVRLLHLKILLYRPVLLPQDEELNSESPIYIALNATISRMCIESALELLNIVWEYKGHCKISKYWYTMFYIYNAAVVILAALLKGHSKNLDIDVLLLDDAWSKALSLLPTYQNHIETANHCLHTLLDAHDRVLSPDKLLDFFFESLI